MKEEKATDFSNSIKERIAWVDIAKGIAILLVIIGHSVSGGIYGSTIRGLIYSFHMPLFFIFSCFTYKMSKDAADLKKKTKKAFMKLIGPAFITFAIIIVWQCFNDKSLFQNRDYWMGKFYTLIFASGVMVRLNEMNVAGIGFSWFFFALFIGRTLFDFCHLIVKDDKKLLILSVLLGIAGILWGKIQWLPFSMDIAFAIQPFFYWGYFLKTCSIEKYTWKKTFLWCIIWLVTLYLAFPDYHAETYLNLAVRRYTLFPVSYLTAIAGTMFISGIGLCIEKLKVLSTLLVSIGKNTLYLLCVHILDNIYRNLWWVENHQFFTAIKRTFIDMLVFIAFMCIRFVVRKVIRSIKSKQKSIVGY